MSSARNEPSQGYPAVPSTLNAGDYEMRDNAVVHQAPAPNTDPYYTPYLGLQARLSQVWINRWTVLLLLIVCRLLLAIASINHDIASAKTEALSACTSVEKVGSAMASMPHYLSDGVNAMAADGITKAVEGLMDMLMLTITGVEEIVLFVINMMTSTYVCLITLAVAGSLHVAIDMIEKVGDAMNKTIGSITGEITTDVGKFQDTLNSFLKGISIPAGIFGGSKDPPQISVTDQVNRLNNIKIDPTTLDGDLAKLNASIPDFADVQNFTNFAIRFPFEQVKKLINDSTGNGNYTFNKDIFPVAQKKELSFCSDNDDINKFFDGLVESIYTARTVFLVVLILAAVLVCAPMAWLEIRRWRSMKQRSKLLQDAAFNPMDVVYIASRPYTASAGITVSEKMATGTKNRILIRWFIAYATSLPALFLLALGLAGLFSCLCQYIVLKLIQKEVPALTAQVGNFTGNVVHALNNASEQWAVDANHVINNTNTQVNQDVFGWVNTSTTAVNNTLNMFSDQMNKALNETFGGTILYDPIKGVMDCLVELKIVGVQKGLTWVHDHAHIEFPEFRPDVFSLGAAASLTNTTADDSFLANPGDVAADDITSAVVKVSDALQRAIAQEAIIAACIIGFWFLVMLMGLGYVLFSMAQRTKHRGEGGAVAYTTGEEQPLSPPRDNPGNFAQFRPAEKRENLYTEDASGSEDERIRHVGRRGVESSVYPGHMRNSSYGMIDEKR